MTNLPEPDAQAAQKKKTSTQPNLKLKRERELRGWSQADVAEKIGAQTNLVTRWETGTAFPSPYYRQRLCQIFEKNAEELGLIKQKPAKQVPQIKTSPPSVSKTLPEDQMIQSNTSQATPPSIMGPGAKPLSSPVQPRYQRRAPSRRTLLLGLIAGGGLLAGIVGASSWLLASTHRPASSPPPTLLSATPTLRGSIGDIAPITDLSREGTIDWAHWGADLSSPLSAVRKSGGSQIGSLSVIGEGAFTGYNDSFYAFSWSNGTPISSGTDHNGVFLTGINQGFSLTVQASPTRRTLKVYVGVLGGQAKLSASLQGKSYSETYSAGATTTYPVYSLEFSGSGPLTITYVLIQRDPDISPQEEPLLKFIAATLH